MDLAVGQFVSFSGRRGIYRDAAGEEFSVTFLSGAEKLLFRELWRAVDARMMPVHRRHGVRQRERERARERARALASAHARGRGGALAR